ncbi:hypothetical protein ALC62_15304 [Cyphomyrmex costatus]|uniref:Uncharacterized protein n=3 Tax=Cyphomyrmex costatus TaxID=456900 RepID=A0A151I800_9HYME|nr:hypothetical protein ALC62_15304 [Cyphomyrmex costatus]
MYRLVANPKDTGDDGCHAAAHPSTDEAYVENDDDDFASSRQLGHAATAK